MPSSDSVPEPIREETGAPDPGPRNVELDRQNPDTLCPPATDKGTMPNLKWPFSLSHNRLEPGGWARQVTTRELPISKAMAGVNMRLTPGSCREMHWHKEAEWAYMIVGRARITCVDEHGHNFADDVGVGDLWYFPPGIPHSIQGLDEGCEFLLVFDNGSFSEDSTFLVTDMLAHLPKAVVAANLGVSVSELGVLPKKERYIFPAKLPPTLEDDQVPNPQGPAAQTFSHRLTAQEPVRSRGGSVRIVDSHNFPVSKHIAAALVEVEPDGMRALHWHPNSDEWQYYLQGQARMTVFASGAKARTFDYQAGDAGYVPVSMPHYVQNTGTETLRFLEVFASDHYADVSLNQWLALTPPELVQQTLMVDVSFLRGLQKTKVSVI